MSNSIPIIYSFIENRSQTLPVALRVGNRANWRRRRHDDSATGSRLEHPSEEAISYLLRTVLKTLFSKLFIIYVLLYARYSYYQFFIFSFSILAVTFFKYNSIRSPSKLINCKKMAFLKKKKKWQNLFLSGIRKGYGTRYRIRCTFKYFICVTLSRGIRWETYTH